MDPSPKKYVRINGMMKLNPEYTKYMNEKDKASGGGGANGPSSLTVPFPSQALPVVSSMDDHVALNEASMAGGGKEIQLAESTNATIDILQDKENCDTVNIPADEVVDRIGNVLQKYEVPIGLVNKLMMLSELDLMEFVVDDSGSMLCDTDTKDPRTGRWLTRWAEAQQRLKEMMEVIAHVATPPINVRFLNRPDVLVFDRIGKDPKAFLVNAYNHIDRAFTKPPQGGTPVYECFQESYLRHKGKSVARYFFGDGVPNGGNVSKQKIVEMTRNRENPSQNPVTLLSCTNEDEEVEWMKNLEEMADYCAEFDDYKDECAEVLRDQGVALPYTKGFHLVGQLVAAMNPDDLDAMDESVPFTKYTLCNILGVELNETEYRHYFDKFQEAQRNRRVDDKMDEMKKNFQWAQHYNHFLSAPQAKSIPAVQEFKRALKLAIGASFGL